jgi:hypothetical protein
LVILLAHPILGGGCLGDDLQDVPVLNDVAVLVEPEDVDPGGVMVTRPDLVTVQHDVVALGTARPLEFALAWTVVVKPATHILYSNAPG